MLTYVKKFSTLGIVMLFTGVVSLFLVRWVGPPPESPTLFVFLEVTCGLLVLVGLLALIFSLYMFHGRKSGERDTDAANRLFFWFVRRGRRWRKMSACTQDQIEIVWAFTPFHGWTHQLRTPFGTSECVPPDVLKRLWPEPYDQSLISRGTDAQALRAWKSLTLASLGDEECLKLQQQLERLDDDKKK
jgi:hypothetical protein